jgi:hypothetical protein
VSMIPKMKTLSHDLSLQGHFVRPQVRHVGAIGAKVFIPILSLDCKL